MRKLLIILFLLISLLTATPIQSATMVSGRPCPGGAGAACTGATQQEPTDMDDNSSVYTIGRYTAADWLATQFIYTGTTGTLCRIDVAFVKVGSPTGNLNVCLYSNNEGEVGTEIACGTINSGSFTDSIAWYSATVDTTITNGVTYWIVVNDPSADGTNYQQWGTDNTCTTENMRGSADGTTWTSNSTAACQEIRLYIKE
jgi:hypothetical protein